MGRRTKRYYLLHVLRKKHDYPNLNARYASRMIVAATVILIEDKASGTQLIQELIEEGVHTITRFKPEATS